MSLIKIESLILSYKSSNFKKQKVILNIPSLKINRGSVIGFFGPNHVGKSTLLKLIANVKSEFSITKESKINHFPIDGKEPITVYIPQDYNSSILPWFSIQKNTRLLLEALKHSKESIELIIKTFYSELGFESESDFYLYYGFCSLTDGNLIYKKVSELSGGQKQIVSILRSILTSPDVIAMDEPFSAIDIFNKGIRFRNDILKYLRKKKTTIIIVSHELEEIIDFTDILYIFNYDDKSEGLVLKGKENSKITKANYSEFVIELNRKYDLNLEL
jgi:ABC-type nitrate/sulfonate/bicarbonate transport system ATPase subunit